MGAPQGNKNHLKNGTRVVVSRLVVGELPSEMIAVKREARAYRRSLEVEVLSCRNKATVEEVVAASRSWKAWESFVNERMNYEDKNYVAAATQQTLAIGINRWLLRNRFEQMSVSDIRACNKEMRDAAKERAKTIREMGLNVEPEPVSLQTLIVEAKRGRTT